MLQWINDRMKVFGWIILMPLSLVFVVWGVQGIVSFSSQADRGLKVNGEQAPVDQMRLSYQERSAQLARAFPEEIPADVKKKVQDGIVDEYVNTLLVDQKVTAQHYAVTDRDVVESIKSYQGFQVAGQFNKDAYYALLKARGYTPDRFEAEQRKLLKARALEGALYLSAFATPTEIARAAALKGETRELGWALLPVAKFMPAAKPEEAAIKAYFDAHPNEFKTPDTVRLSYVELKVADIAHEVAVDEGGLKAFYETIKERFVEPERRHARHILIQSGKDDAAAQKQAQDVYAQATRPGADFAALAKQYSQDAGSKEQGGDLGTVDKSAFVGAFADALFSMQQGQVKGPVKTQFGWHVIKLEEVVPAKSKSFEEAKAEIEPEYKRTEAERRFGERQEKLEQLAFENNGSLEPVAKALGLKIEEVPAFYQGLVGNALAANAKLVKAAFSADVIGGQNSRPVELAPGDVVVVRATDHRAPALQPLEAVHAQAETGAKKVLAAQLAAEAATRLVAALNAGGKWDEALKPLAAVAPTPAKPVPADAVKFVAPAFVGRKQADVPAPVLRELFRVKTPADGKAVVASLVLPGGDVVVYAVTGIKPGLVSSDPTVDRRAIAGPVGEGDIATYIGGMRAKADIRLNAQTIFE